MNIELNNEGLDGYYHKSGYLVIANSPVADVPAGSVWLITADPDDEDGEDVIRLIDLGEECEWPEDEIAAFVAARQTAISFDWSQSGAPRTADLEEAAKHMLSLADEQLNAGEFA